MDPRVRQCDLRDFCGRPERVRPDTRRDGRSEPHGGVVQAVRRYLQPAVLQGQARHDLLQQVGHLCTKDQRGEDQHQRVQTLCRLPGWSERGGGPRFHYCKVQAAWRAGSGEEGGCTE